MSWQVVLEELDNPRGITLGPDGLLYVAEGGRGGTELSTSPNEHAQVPPPIGPYTAGAPSARITRFRPDGGGREVVAAGLPSSQTSSASGAMASGVADLAFIGGELYALVTGAGPSHGLAGTCNGIVRIDAGGKTSQIADLSAFWRAHPPAISDPDDAEPDGTPFSMIAVRGRLLVVESHGGTLDWVSTGGEIERLVDLSKSRGHLVPTSIFSTDGKIYLVTLGRFPVRVGSARLLEIGLDGEVRVCPPRLTAATGLAADGRGNLYVVEATTVEGSGPARGSGRLVRVRPEATKVEVIAAGLDFPTAVCLGPEGELYFANRSFGFPPGEGEILRIPLRSRAD